MRNAYRFLLMLYPRGHRDQFTEEMTGVFEEARNERHYQGWAWYVRFCLAEVTGLVAGAASAWFSRRTAPKATVAGAPRSALPPELIEAQRRLDLNITGMVHSIANNQYIKARFHSDEERQARETLRQLREKYGIID